MKVFNFDTFIDCAMMNTKIKYLSTRGAFYRLRSNEILRLLVPDLVNASVGKWERHCYLMNKYCQFHFLYACKESFFILQL